RRSVEREEEGRVSPRLTVSPIDVSTCPQPPESVRGFFVLEPERREVSNGSVRDRAGRRRGLGLARPLRGPCPRVLRRAGVRFQPYLALSSFSRPLSVARGASRSGCLRRSGRRSPERWRARPGGLPAQ